MRKRKTDDDLVLFKPIDVTKGRKYHQFWLGWDLVFGFLNLALFAWNGAARDWGSAAINMTAAVLLFGLYFWARRARRKHEAYMARLEQDRMDSRSRMLNDYYARAARRGEYSTYRFTQQYYNDATLQELGIYKSPAELEELRIRDSGGHRP